MRIDGDADLAGLAGVALGAVLAEDLHDVHRHRLAHGARARRGVREVAHGERGLRLAEALVDGKAGMLAPEVEQIGVQRFAGRGAVLQAGQVEGVHVHLGHEAVHRRRAAERRHAVATDEGENLGRIVAVEVVGEHCGLHEPLAEELAPDRLAPAGVGDGEVQPLGVYVVPVLGRDEVRQRVAGIVEHHLGIARSARGEVHEHGIGARRLAAGEIGRGGEHLAVEVAPALARDGGRADARRARERLADKLAGGSDPVPVPVARGEPGAGRVHEDERLHAGALLYHRVDGVGDVPGRGGDDGLDIRPVQAIGEVVFLQHEGGRYRHRPQFLQGQHREPELVVAAQDDHDEVAAPDAAVRQEVRRLVRPRLHVGEGEDMLLPFRIAPDHGGALGVVDRDVVHDVVGEVEVVGHGDVELREQTVLVVGLVHVAQVDVSHDDILG